MESFLLVLHIILSFVIVVAILMQSGQGGGLGAGFSSAAAAGQEVFGGRGAASFLGKLTVFLGASFMITSMALAWYSSKPQSALDLQETADQPVGSQVHEIIEEGTGGAPPPGQLPDGAQQMQPSIDLDGDGGDIPDDIRRQLEELGAEMEISDEIPAGEDLEVLEPEEAIEVEEAPDTESEAEVEPDPAVDAEVEPELEAEPTPELEVESEPESEETPEFETTDDEQ